MSKPVLPKWPFIIGDAALVALAVHLANKTGPLTPGQLFWIFTAIGTGALLFVLPFILEFRVLTKLHLNEQQLGSEQRDQKMALLYSEFQDIGEASRRQVDEAERVTANLEGLIQRLEGRLAPIEQSTTHLEKLGHQLAETAKTQAAEEAALAREVQNLRQNLANGATTAAAPSGSTPVPADLKRNLERLQRSARTSKATTRPLCAALSACSTAPP